MNDLIKKVMIYHFLSQRVDGVATLLMETVRSVQHSLHTTSEVFLSACLSHSLFSPAWFMVLEQLFDKLALHTTPETSQAVWRVILVCIILKSIHPSLYFVSLRSQTFRNFLLHVQRPFWRGLTALAL